MLLIYAFIMWKNLIRNWNVSFLHKGASYYKGISYNAKKNSKRVISNLIIEKNVYL